MKRSRCGTKVVFSGANTDPKSEAASRYRIQARCLFCEHTPVVQRSKQNCGHQTDTLGHCSSGCQGNKGIVVCVDQAVKATKTGKRTAIRSFGPIQDKLTLHPRNGSRVTYTNFHRYLLREIDLLLVLKKILFFLMYCIPVKGLRQGNEIIPISPPPVFALEASFPCLATTSGIVCHEEA